MMKNKRIQYFDIAKGIGMLAIITGHIIRNAGVHAVIYSWHVPLFFLISGYFLSKKSSVLDFTKNRAKQLLLPYVFTSLALILLSPFGQMIRGHGFDLQSSVKWLTAALYGAGWTQGKYTLYLSNHFPIIGATWFLLALFIAQVIVRFFIDYKYGILGILALVVIGYLSTPYVWLPLSIQAGMFSSLFVYIGYWARKFSRKSGTDPLKPRILPVLASGIIWGYLVITFVDEVVAINYYGNGLLLSILAILSATYLVLLLSQLIEKYGGKWLNQALLFMGTNSLIILSLHLLDLNLLNWEPVLKFLGMTTWTEGALFLFRIFLYALGTILVKKVQTRIQKARQPRKILLG